MDATYVRTYVRSVRSIGQIRHFIYVQRHARRWMSVIIHEYHQYARVFQMRTELFLNTLLCTCCVYEFDKCAFMTKTIWIEVSGNRVIAFFAKNFQTLLSK